MANASSEKKTKKVTKKVVKKDDKKEGLSIATLLEYYQAMETVINKIDNSIAMYTQGNKISSLQELPPDLAEQLPTRQIIDKKRSKIFSALSKRILDLKDEDII